MKVQFSSSKTAATMLAAYLLGLGVIVFAARLTDLGLPQVVEAGLENLHSRQLVPGIRFGHVEAGANVLLFIPVGLLVSRMLPRRYWWFAVGIGVAMSLTIELIQAVALAGRNASPRDVVCNSLGTMVGSFIASTISRRPAHPLTQTADERA